MRRILAVSVIASLVLVSGCETSNERAGTVVGGVLGGVLGSEVGGGSGRDVAMVAGAIAGAIAGALIGGSVGRSMDRTDRLRAQRTLETTPTGRTVAWENPDHDAAYRMTPERTYETASGPCRDYSMDAWIDGRKETVTGTACRQSDGTWKTM